MDIHRIAHYLDGSFPPYYRAPYNILIFCHDAIRISQWKLKETDLYTLSNMWIKWCEMFRHVLEFLTPSQQHELARTCVPEDIFHEITKEPFTLSTKQSPTMNAYNTLVLMTEEAYNNASKKKLKVSDLVVLPFEVRLGRSEENVKAEILRLLPDNLDIEDVTIMISPIF